MNLDIAIFLFINKSLANSFLDFVVFYIDKLPYVVYTALVLFSIVKNRSLAILLLVSLVLTGLFIPQIKEMIGRDRPYETLDARVLVTPGTEKSFPSNHAVQAFLAATLVFGYYRRIGIILFVFATIVSLGRVYIGVHYISDILGGAVIGILFALLLLKVDTKLQKRITKKKR